MIASALAWTCCVGRGRRRQVDLADMIFVGALGGLQPRDHLLHLVVADVDERLDLAAQQALPGQLALDLALERGWREEPFDFRNARELVRRLLELRRTRAEGLVDLGLGDVDLCWPWLPGSAASRRSGCAAPAGAAGRFSSGAHLWPLAASTRASRWSTSVSVMMAPLTIAVALRTLGSNLPKICDVVRAG